MYHIDSEVGFMQHIERKFPYLCHIFFEVDFR